MVTLLSSLQPLFPSIPLSSSTQKTLSPLLCRHLPFSYSATPLTQRFTMIHGAAALLLLVGVVLLAIRRFFPSSTQQHSSLREQTLTLIRSPDEIQQRRELSHLLATFSDSSSHDAFWLLCRDQKDRLSTTFVQTLFSSLHWRHLSPCACSSLAAILENRYDDIAQANLSLGTLEWIYRWLSRHPPHIECFYRLLRALPHTEEGKTTYHRGITLLNAEELLTFLRGCSSPRHMEECIVALQCYPAGLEKFFHGSWNGGKLLEALLCRGEEHLAAAVRMMNASLLQLFLDTNPLPDELLWPFSKALINPNHDHGERCALAIVFADRLRARILKQRRSQPNLYPMDDLHPMIASTMLLFEALA